MHLRELTSEQRRQLIDTQQVYEAWREAAAEKRRRFTGGMRWAERNGTDYLLRKIGVGETSLGTRNDETTLAFNAFMTGRTANKEKLQGLSKRLDAMARVNVAMGLGRIPTIAARIVRRCDEKGLLGKQLFVVGTNALYAYEAMAGVHIASGLVASGDIDLLLDARRHLSLAAENSVGKRGLIGMLQQIDRSFDTIHVGSYRAANQDGYMVDLIRPEARNVFKDKAQAALTNLPDDMQGASIFGLGWLINAPKTETTVLDERGYPAQLTVIDPRAFALHKTWIAERPEREPLKAVRDREQALAATLIATHYLRMPFDSAELTALPAQLRQMAPRLIELAGRSDDVPRENPNW